MREMSTRRQPNRCAQWPDHAATRITSYAATVQADVLQAAWPHRTLDPLRSFRYLNSCRSNVRKRTAHFEEQQAAHVRVPQESRQRDAPSWTIAAGSRLTWR
jgi:hypothetical protein